MAMVNMNVNNLLNGKDSRWLQLEVCREFQRNKCSRSDTECKFAHPPANVEVQNGRVTACYDSIKGRCNREKPPCKYFHPPQHLKDQLLINGRNHLALKNALMQQMGLSPGQPIVPGQVPTVAANPYLTGMPQVGSTYSPYFATGPIVPTIMGPDHTGVASQLGVPQSIVAQQKMPRSDRLEVCREFQRGACKRAESECRFAHPADSVTANEDGTVTVCMDAVKGRCNRDPCRYFHPPLHLQAQIKAAQSRASAPATVSPLLAPQSVAALEIGKKRPRDQTAADTDLLLMDMKTVGSYYYDNFAFPGMMPYKRPAADKSGMPVYQPNATTYQQLMQMQQPFVPVSCEYQVSPISAPATTCASPSAAGLITAASDHTLSAAAVAAVAQQQQQQSQPIVNDDPLALPASNAASLSTPAAAMPDPAALAKEVAQQNYAKAVKLAAVNAANQAAAVAHHNMAANSFSNLNPVNYTGVALNKQMNLPPPNMTAFGFQGATAAAAAAAGLARYPHLQHLGGLNHAAATGGFNPMSNPYAAAAAHAAAMQNANLLNMARAAPPSAAVAAAAAQAQAAAAAAAVGYPYSFMRGNPYNNAIMPPGGSGYLSTTQYPHHTIAPTPVTSSNRMSAAAAAAAAAVQNNNNVVMQPYKKLKTT